MKWPIAAVLVLAGSVHLRADEAATFADVKAADDARVAAMTAADSGKLGAVLSDDLHYAHSENFIESKVEHIASLASRRLIYRRVDYKTRDFSLVAPGVVLGKGHALVEVGSKRMIFQVDINFLAVWRLENQRWRLFAWQSSRNEEIVPLGPPSENVPPPSADVASVRREFSALLSPRIDLAAISEKDASDLRLIFSAVRKAKSDGKRFGLIAGVEFDAPNRARIAFTWSGGMHGGFFTLTKREGAWTITDEAWLL